MGFFAFNCHLLPLVYYMIALLNVFQKELCHLNCLEHLQWCIHSSFKIIFFLAVYKARPGTRSYKENFPLILSILIGWKNRATNRIAPNQRTVNLRGKYSSYDWALLGITKELISGRSV